MRLFLEKFDFTALYAHYDVRHFRDVLIVRYDDDRLFIIARHL